MASVNPPGDDAQPTIAPHLLAALQAEPHTLSGLYRGVEKESLRVAPDGSLSTMPHPRSLGSPLTHRAITTDFSEAQLELITGVHPSAAACLQELTDVHRFVYANIDDELLWPSSMPCLVGDEDEIPVGQYGRSNIGRTKTVYRLGLGLRYGRLMQTISGIHYNFSLPDRLWHTLGISTQEQRTAAYFSLIRNFRRWSWLLIYLFGASPAVCRSFTRNLDHSLIPFDEGSQHLPYATSLRMGPLGYQSNAQSALHISYNSLDEYANSMVEALTLEYPEYARYGVKNDSQYQQLNTAVLQIENEFYGTIRPKRRTRTGERPITALRARGVEYVEVRCLDLNPFLPVGLDEQQIHFLDTFLMLCLLANSAPDHVREFTRIAHNQQAIVERGRDPALRLTGQTGQETSPRQWGHTLLDQCAILAQLMDRNETDAPYTAATGAQRSKLDNPELTPSAGILATMRARSVPFFRFSMDQGFAQKAHFSTLPLSAEEKSRFEQEVADSLSAQQAIEAADELTFDEFLEQYLAMPEGPRQQQTGQPAQ